MYVASHSCGLTNVEIAPVKYLLHRLVNLLLHRGWVLCQVVSSVSPCWGEVTDGVGAWPEVCTSWWCQLGGEFVWAVTIVLEVITMEISYVHFPVTRSGSSNCSLYTTPSHTHTHACTHCQTRTYIIQISLYI